MMSPSDAQQAETQRELSIDELSAVSGVPSRTIRFYQGKGILPHPRKRGRVAMYDASHLDRLKLISELQERGLRLTAIRDLLSRPEATPATIHEWLGVSERVGRFSEDSPIVMTEAEIRQGLDDYRPGVINMLLRTNTIERQGDNRYLIKSAALLRVAAALRDAGISLEVAIALREILEKRLARAADEMVNYAIEHIGRGFGKSDDPKDVAQAVEALMPSAAGGDAVLLIFGRAVSQALSERMEQGASVISRRSRERR